MDKVPITRLGFQALKDRLRRLRREERPRILEELQEARSHGLGGDNPLFLSARARQLGLQRQIDTLTERIERCEIFVGRKTVCPQVSFGSRVTIRNLASGEVLTLRLVGPYEADPTSGTVSIESPVGRELCGCFEGDAVTVLAPAGERTYVVLTIDD